MIFIRNIFLILLFSHVNFNLFTFVVTTVRSAFRLSLSSVCNDSFVFAGNPHIYPTFLFFSDVTGWWLLIHFSFTDKSVIWVLFSPLLFLFFPSPHPSLSRSLSVGIGIIHLAEWIAFSLICKFLQALIRGEILIIYLC